MFNVNKNVQPPKPVKKAAPTRNSAVTILTSGCHFNGKLFCRGSSRIGGKIEGEIVSEGLLIIEESAVINAEITADEAIIQGAVEGKLTAKGRVELAATSRFDGDINTPSLMVTEGAQFNGRSFMQRAETERALLEAVDGNGVDVGPDASMDPNQVVDDNAPDVAVM